MVLLAVLVILAATFGALTYGQYVLQNTWVYQYLASVEAPTDASGSLILPVPLDISLLSGLQLVEGNANWSNVATPYGPGLFVAFTGPATIRASLRLFAPQGSHPNDDLATTAGVDPWEVWIHYAGDDAPDLRFQYGGGYVINPAMGYYGPLKPGWNVYEMFPAP